MLGVFEAEPVRYLRHGFTGSKPVLGKLDNEPVDMVACRIPGCLFFHVPEIVGRHAQLVRAVLHGRQAVGELEPILEVAAEQAVETDQDVGVLDFTGNELMVVETLAEIEGQLDISYDDGLLESVRPLVQFFADLPHQRYHDVVLLIGHVQGLVHPVVEKLVAPDVPFERKAVEQVGMEQERPAGNGHPLSVVFLATTGAGVFPSDR